MTTRYQHLGIFSDWVDEARRQQPLYPLAAPGVDTQRRLREVLGFGYGPETPLAVRVEQHWERDGLLGEEVSWSVGYGPRTHAWVFKPAGATEPLPAIVALHDHGGFKYYGKEKIAAGPTDPPPMLVNFWQQYYGGRAYVNALAQAGFVVLVHDTFLWGSRRFPLEVMPAEIRAVVTAAQSDWRPAAEAAGVPAEVAEYNAATWHHEHWIEKYCNLLGATLAGVVSHEDRIALNYLLSRPDVQADRAGCLGLSGGGNRSALLLATHNRIQAAVIVGLMTTYAELLDHNMSHTWMLLPHGWSRYGDWPDIAACRAPLPLLVQYDLADDLFTLKGMQDAHQRLLLHYQNSGGVGGGTAYTGQFYPGPHKFDLEMQADAFAWLHQHLAE